MTVRLTEALQELETDNRNFAIGVVAGLLGAFPLDHAVRKYAAGCPKVLEKMDGVTPLSEAEAMKAVLGAACGSTNDPERYGKPDHRDKPNVSIEDIADRIRMAVRPAKADVRAERGARMQERMQERMAMSGARFRRPTRPVRAPACY